MRPYPPPGSNPCWCVLRNDSLEPPAPIGECPVHGVNPWSPRSERDGWKSHIFYWAYPGHDHGMPEGEPDGPFLSLADAMDCLLPGGTVVENVAYSGTWLGEHAEWPVLATEP
jgi:hypothetical protein